MLIELSPRAVELLDNLHLYWPELADFEVIERALMVYIRWLADDDHLISDDDIIRAWRKFHWPEV